MLHDTNINKLSWEAISAAVAQMVERMALNHVVAGSIPVGGLSLAEVIQLLK